MRSDYGRMDNFEELKQKDEWQRDDSEFKVRIYE